MRRFFGLLILALCLVLLGSIFLLYYFKHREHWTLPQLLKEIQKAKGRLEDEIENLRSRGVPISQVYVSKVKGALVVELSIRCSKSCKVKEAKENYVKPIREIIGYDIPILFPKPPEKVVLIGNPPVPLDDLEKAIEKWKQNIWKENPVLAAETSLWIDSEKGLLLALTENLTPNRISEIREIVGYDIPIEIKEPNFWITSLYIGKPGTKTVKKLEEARKRIIEFHHRNKTLELQVLDVIDEEEASLLGEEGTLLCVEIRNITFEKVRIIREIVGYDVPLLIEEGEAALDRNLGDFDGCLFINCKEKQEILICEEKSISRGSFPVFRSRIDLLAF